MSACRNVVVGARCAGSVGAGRLGFHSEWVVFREMWRSFISGKNV